MWEIYFCDSGETVEWSTRKCNKYFGKDEFNEIIQGYAPHIVVVKLSAEEIEERSLRRARHGKLATHLIDGWSMGELIVYAVDQLKAQYQADDAKFQQDWTKAFGEDA